MSNQVCAVIVTFYPDQDLAERIHVLLKQVDGLVVVDNKSDDSVVKTLRGLAYTSDFKLLENSNNLGIGAALNLGIQWAVSQSRFTHVALFDQDSEIGPDFFVSMFKTIQEHAHPDQVAIVAPKIFNRNTGATDGPRRGSNGSYLVAQTSGSLMPLNVFRTQGWYREDLFIDYVDFEYCLRVISAGWAIVCCEAAVLLHVPGNSKRHFLMGIYLGTSENYSPLRHYYSTRNGLWVVREYWNKQPEWCRGQVLRMLKGRFRVLLFEKNRPAKFMSSYRGLRDALQGRLGQRMFVATKKVSAQ